jgi:hypothetical protein
MKSRFPGQPNQVGWRAEHKTTSVAQTAMAKKIELGSLNPLVKGTLV